MKIQKAVVQYKDRDDIICMYGIVDDGTKEGKKLYFLGDDETKKFSNGYRVVTEALVEAVDPMVEPKHIGLIDKKGNVIIPLDNRAIKPINDKMILVEKATPVSQSVIDAVEARKGSNGASGLVATSAAIKDAMNIKMGPEGRFLFNDQFSEATICDIEGKNLVGNQSFSYVSMANDLLYLSTNVADSEIKEFSISKGEFVENKSEAAIDVNAVGVDPQVVNNALANEVHPEIPTLEAAAAPEQTNQVVPAVPAEAGDVVTPPLGFDDFFKGEGSSMPADSVEVTDDNKEVMKLINTATMPTTLKEDAPKAEEGDKTEEFIPEIPAAVEGMANQEVGENSMPAPPDVEIPTLEGVDNNESQEVATPPVVDVAAELQNIKVNLDEGVHDDVNPEIPAVAEATPEAPLADVVPVADAQTEQTEEAPAVEDENKETVNADVPLVPTNQELEEVASDAKEETTDVKEETKDEAVSPIPEVVASEAEENKDEEVVEKATPEATEEVTEEVKEEVKTEDAIPAIPEVEEEAPKNEEVVIPKVEETEAKEETVEKAPVEETVPAENVVEETKEESVVEPAVEAAPVEDTPVADSAPVVPEVEAVKPEVNVPALDTTPVADTNIIKPEDVSSLVDKDANGILDSDELISKERRMAMDDSLDDILGKDFNLDLDLNTPSTPIDNFGSKTIMDDVVKSMSELVKQNKDQRATITNLQGKLSLVESQRDTVQSQRDMVADKYREQSRKLELLTSKLKNLDSITNRLEGKIREKDQAIAKLQSEVQSLSQQINGKQDLVDILRDAQQLLDNDYDSNYLSKVA